MSERTLDDLRQLQALPLHLKIDLTKARIRQWVHEFGVEGVYVSFSGGKDSTVLLHLVRELYPDVPAVFCDTGLEFPEIREFVKTFDNVVILKPKLTFKQVIQKYGYPFISKETAEVVYQSKRYLQKLAESEGLVEQEPEYAYSFRKITGSGEFAYTYDSDKPCEEQKVDLLSLAKKYNKWDMPYRISVLLGQYESYWQKKKAGLLPKDGAPSRGKYSQKRWAFMLNAPFNISHLCCNVMKKEPSHRYAKETGRRPITGQMADESMLRTQKWMQYGCNGFQMKEPISNPMSFWTEQDVLQYIKEFGIKIAPVYGDIVEASEGQMMINEDGTISLPNSVLKTTGCRRTGCVFCGFGCHLERDGEHRFVKLKESHPKLYDYVMRDESLGGLGYKEKIDWINEHGNTNIKY
jgi:3'-phosphoadenosine 5'-phosphosulfate sulfotransferase (PAPS reductase)/FAD synthetase